MPDNESPRVALAREAASKLKAKAVVMIYVSEDGSTIGVASWGNKPETDEAIASLGDGLFFAANEQVLKSRAWGDKRI
jgi:hypothetical protein